MRCCQARFKAGNRCRFPPTPGHVPSSTRSLLKCSWVLEVEFVRYELEMETAQQTQGQMAKSQLERGSGGAAAGRFHGRADSRHRASAQQLGQSIPNFSRAGRASRGRGGPYLGDSAQERVRDPRESPEIWG